MVLVELEIKILKVLGGETTGSSIDEWVLDSGVISIYPPIGHNRSSFVGTSREDACTCSMFWLAQLYNILFFSFFWEKLEHKSMYS